MIRALREQSSYSYGKSLEFVHIKGSFTEESRPLVEFLEQWVGRYEKAYLCADSPSVSYLDENLEPAGTAVRGSEVTYSAENTRKKDGVTYYLTYLDSLKYGYIAETNLTDNPDDVVREESVFVRTPQNLRLDPDSVELGGLLEKGTELKIVGYDYMTDGIVHLYQVTAGEETGKERKVLAD